MLGRDVCNTLSGGKTVKNRTDTFLTASQKRKDKKLIFTQWFMRFSSSPRQFVLLKTTINNAGQNLAAKSNRRLSSSYNETFKKQNRAKH